MPPVGFEPTISAGERPQTYALDRAATGTGRPKHVVTSKLYLVNKIMYSQVVFDSLFYPYNCFIIFKAEHGLGLFENGIVGNFGLIR